MRLIRISRHRIKPSRYIRLENATTSLELTFETNLLEEIDLARLLPEILPVVDVGRVGLDAGAGAAVVVDQETEALLRRPAPEIRIQILYLRTLE